MHLQAQYERIGWEMVGGLPRLSQEDAAVRHGHFLSHIDHHVTGIDDGDDGTSSLIIRGVVLIIVWALTQEVLLTPIGYRRDH